MLSQLGEPECYETIYPSWERSLASLPPEGPPFAHPKQLLEYRELAGIDPRVDEELLACGAIVQSSPALGALLWHCHQCAYVYAEAGRFDDWPTLETSLGSLNGAFYLIVALALIPLTVAAHRSAGFPDWVTRETVTAPASFLDRYRRGRQGRNGVFQCEIWWLRKYVQAEIVRIGRFEYRLHPFQGRLRVYRRGDTGETVALAEAGVRFDREGYMEPESGNTDDYGWTARFEQLSGRVEGNPIAPDGHALRRTVALDLRRWECVLARERSRILDIHIPSGGKMTMEAIVDSLGRAADLFSHRLGPSAFAGFSCISWILSPYLTKILAPSSNIITFMHEVYLFPVPRIPADGLFFVFSDPRFYGGELSLELLKELTPKTSLEEKVRRYILDTDQWRGGGMFLLTEDLPKLGTRCYRTGWRLYDETNNE